MSKSDATYTETMDKLVLATVGVFLTEPTGTSQVRTLLELLRKLVQSCLELAGNEASGETESGYTWEQKIESLVTLAKAAGRFLNAEAGTDYCQDAHKKLVFAYEAFCQWRHDEPYVVDEIWELLRRREYTDAQTGVRLIVEKDNPGHPGVPRLTIACPETGGVTAEQVQGAMARLFECANIPVGQRIPAPFTQKEGKV